MNVVVDRLNPLLIHVILSVPKELPVFLCHESAKPIFSHQNPFMNGNPRLKVGSGREDCIRDRQRIFGSAPNAT